MEQTFLNVKIDDIKKSKILTNTELDFINSGFRIPHAGDNSDLWECLRSCQVKVFRAIQSGKLKEIERESPYQKTRYYIQTDSTCANSIQGIKSMVDGKVYDSKSAYYKSLKEAGCSVYEPGMVAKEKQFDHGKDSVLQRQVYEAIQKHS